MIASLGLSYVLNHITVWLQVISGWVAQMGIVWDVSSFNLGGLLGGMGGLGMGGGSVISIVPVWLLVLGLVFATAVSYTHLDVYKRPNTAWAV